MAFKLDQIQHGTLPSGQAPAIHTYYTEDSLADVEGANYFDAVSEHFDEDVDLLLVVANVDATTEVAIYRPTVSAGSVTLNALHGQSALTDNSGGTANDTIAAVSGTGDDGNVNDNFADLAAKVNSLLELLGAT